MKKRKILCLFPLAALLLSGCDFDPQAILSGAKDFISDKIVAPVKQLINPSEEQKEEGKKEEQQGGGQQGEGEQSAKVTKVTISGADETTVLDGSRVTLKAAVAGDEGVSQKVTWASSDAQVATVTNGVVNFLKVSEQKKVTISATAQADATKKAEVEFTVEHSPFDLKNSRGNPDASLFLEEGKFVVEDPQDVALIYADIHDTRWYAEATIVITELDKTDAYPKFGIMASERDDGFWCHEQSKQIFYYADTPSAQTTWTGLNVVPENAEATDWFWSGQICPGQASPAMKLGEAFKMGLMRDGDKFYTFYGKATDLTLGLVGACEYTHFGDQPNYVWVGGWKTAAEVSEVKYLVGDQIDALYEVPQNMSLKSNEETIYLGNSYQIEVLTEGLWDRNKLTFASDNEEIATVSERGLVTANATTAGTAHITVGLKNTEISATFTLHVTDDELFNVVLDGEMNDLIWSETVKTNMYLLKKDDSNYVKIYGAKNSLGLYFFMDYTTRALANCNPNEWWTWENVEFRLANDSKAWSAQYWLSSMNGGSFVTCATETGLPIFYKALTEGSDGLFHGAFEMHIPYGTDCVTKGEATYACFGYAPKDGWYAGYNWYAAITENTLNITANGFAHDGTSCSEGHAYGNWIVDVAATCSSVGSRHKTCSICGHTITEEIPIDPEAHVFDYEHATQTVVPTCSHTGIGTAICTLCGAEENTVLPIDYNNHEDTDYVNGTHSHCSACGIGSYLTNPNGDTYDRSNVGGPWDRNGWYDVGVFSGDFTFVFELHMTGGCGGNADDWGSYCWRTVLPFVYAENYTGDTNGHFFRMDWCGFGGDAFLQNIDNGSNVAGLYPSAWDVFNNSDIKLTYKKVGAKITLNWNITCCATTGDWAGVVIDNYNQSCELKDATANVGIALASEFALCNITKASLTR